MIFSLSMIISALLFALSSMTKKDHLNRYLILLGSVFYALMVAFKGESGSDTYIYVRVYENILNTSIDSFAFMEIGLYGVFFLVKKLDLPFDFVNYINAVLVFFSIYLLASKKDPILAVFYIAFVGINVDFSTLRQSFALHMFSILFFTYNKNILATVLASFFHFSSVFSFSVEMVRKKITLTKIVFFVSAIAVLLCVFLERYINEGATFIFRSSPQFLFQTIAIFLFFLIVGYGYKSLCMITLLSIVPIGFRLMPFVLIMAPVSINKCSFKKKFFLSAYIILLLLVKLYSFSIQSIENDHSRSVILRYEALVEL